MPQARSPRLLTHPAGPGGDPVHRARADDLSWREVDGTVVLLDERDWQYLQLNGSGAVLWPLLEGGATSSQLADALVERFAIARAVADADVALFLTDLRDRELISSAP